MDFSMNATWSRSVELVRDNFQLLAVIGGLFLLLPTMAGYLLIPDFQALVDPSTDADASEALMAELAGPLSVLLIVAIVLNFAGYATMVALMGRARPTVGTALKTGFAAVPSTIGILILFVIAYMIGSIAVIAPVSLLASLGGVPVLSVIGAIVVVVLMIWLMARFSLSLPALVLGHSLNPAKAMAHSFRLTRPRQWAITLFWVVIFAVYLLVSLLVTGLFGVVAALMGTGTAAMALLGLVNGATAMAVGILVSAIAVAMFTHLAGPDAEQIERTFD